MVILARDCTNAKISIIKETKPKISESDKHTYLKETTNEEIRAFFGPLFIRGSTKQHLRFTNKLFLHKSSKSAVKARMSLNRFNFLVATMQFDNSEDRQERWKNDRFTAMRKFFDKFNENCAKLRIPTEFLSIDETLYPYRGKIQIRQYNPNKPAKYGLLYKSISTYFTLPYAGKPEEIIVESVYVTGTDNYTKYLVEGLEKQTNIQGRNISMDRYFTSMTIAEYLLKKAITLVGTMRTDRIGIPAEMKEVKNRKSPSTLYAYNKNIKSLLVSYVVKKKSGVRNVLVLSTMHKNALTTKDERKKPHVITFYDRTKGGVDVMDMMASTYTVKFKSRRWTMNALAYILDTVRTNMTTLWNELNPESKMSSFDFLWQLSEELIKPHILARSQSTGMQKHVTDAMKEVLGGDFEPALMQSLEVSQVA